jgi:peptidoglycan/xylan/chitin deacetylase (PgdA/CDA1 family)
MVGRFYHRLLSAAYHPLKCVKAVGRVLRLLRADRLRVLLYHDVGPGERRAFADQLRWLARHWNFVTPQQFGDMVAGVAPIRGPNLLLTFDDGYASNRAAAEEVLEPLGIRALFFVVSDFIALEDRQEAREFIARHILPGSKADALPVHLENMKWRDLEYLLDRGHSIGGHTRTHAMLSRLHLAADLEGEIVGGADMIERRLGMRVDHFAYTFGDLASFTPEALAVCRRRFRFIFSGLRGDNAGDIPLFALRRDAVTASDPRSLLGTFLEGGADFRYFLSRWMLKRW